jgi:hypothetical protein
VVLDLRGFIAPAFFFVIDLRVEETSNDYARNKRRCEPNAKAHHGAERNRARRVINGIVKKS